MDLVTGGSGFIGKLVVAELRRAGRRVRVLDLREWVGDRDGVEFIRGSVTDPNIADRAAANCERIFHLAANPNLWARDPGDFDKVNHKGTRVLLEAAKKHRPKRFIYTSTESILKSRYASGHDGAAMIDESVRLTLGDMPGPYCRSKFLAEEAARQAALEGLPVVIVNPTMPIGPGDELLTPPMKMLLGFLNGDIPAYLNCEFNLVDARDAARGHLLAAERGRVGERYILGGTNLRLSDMLREIENLTGLAMPKRRVPYEVALLAALFSEALAKFTSKPPMAPLTGVLLARTSLAFDSRKARSELGWETRPLRSTLADAIEWLWSRGLLKRALKGAS